MWCGFFLQEHNCTRELRSIIRCQEQKISDFQQDLNDCKYQLAEQRREISLLKVSPSSLYVELYPLSRFELFQDLMRALRLPTHPPRTVTNQIQDDEVSRWAASLPRARVTRWGGMISTPDGMLQVRILIDF